MTFTDRIRPAAVAGGFYPDDEPTLRRMIAEQLDYARTLLTDDVLARLPQGAPKAVIVPHAGYIYSGTTAALAYALLERGRGTIRRAVIVGPTHRVPVHGVAMSQATAFRTPLGTVPIDVAAETRALEQVPALMVNDPTHAREHAVEVQIPFLQTVLGDDLEIIPLNAGDATPREVGDVLRALWGGPETVIVISSDLSHYHPNAYARMLDDETIVRIAAHDLPIHPNRACGAYPVNGLLDVCRTGGSAGETYDLRFLGCSTSGDDGVVALADRLTDAGCGIDGEADGNGESGDGAAHATRPAMAAPDEPVVGYASFAMWQNGSNDHEGTADHDAVGQTGSADIADAAVSADRGRILIAVARSAIRNRLGLQDDDNDAGNLETLTKVHPWLSDPGASFVTLTENGRLRGCIGTLQAHQPLGRDVAEHAVDAAMRDPRFMPVTPLEYPLLEVEVSVLSEPRPMAVRSRDELERALRPGEDGLIISDGLRHRATFLPQVWDELPEPADFVGHLLAKAGLPAGYEWHDGEIACSRYTVTAYREAEQS
ncbi:AMMECR1 family protein [Bifidobacterium margollesii]|uniref:AMMECR1 family protein n=1 Tax=Bifidobacterium margollesii TaxID=2020964 RepID=A0A2N5JB58_9BIFI|nr:AmmeMemoRadiSam system protein B [Bifidobacterium margollesii]PLS31446.1 AMMECR1 family protein [Bifidobacterium margollesii]